MHFRTNLLLTILGFSSQFACGFSMKPQKTFRAIIPKNNIEQSSTTLHYNIKKIDSIANNKRSEYLLSVRGGSAKSSLASDDIGDSNASSRTLGKTLASFWASFGVVMILGKSIKRVLPIALEPFNGSATPLSTFQLVSYIGMCLYFAYVEGYKGFQLKFSPLVVARSQTLTKESPIHHTLLGPFYAMGLFHATKKRKIVSWSVTIGVGLIVAAVKRMPYPWRNIIDAGVIVGLSWGSLSICVEWIKAIVMGIETKMDPALPQP